MSLCPSVQTVLTGAFMIITAELLLRADVAQNLDLGGEAFSLSVQQGADITGEGLRFRSGWLIS
ncbi:hypothetical protein AAJCM20276_00390 [Acetobacter aceti]|uniref:Uncharacterized protein n=1 Tax=Acetobacter aceti TaxID=435 RepID=A0A6S6PFP9_ACEAC|nr:hypothetical protein AAJCM20276_00390 [Acetobacter aceti]